MHDVLTPDQPRMAPVVKRGRRLSPIWIIPVVAALLGVWLAVKYYSARGPLITVRFETAEGIVEGKTPVLCRSVNVGTVESVNLTENLKGVDITMQMTAEATRLLTKDAQIGRPSALRRLRNLGLEHDCLRKLHRTGTWVGERTASRFRRAWKIRR